MKKFILILIVLTFTLSLFALQTIRVTVHSNATANGTVLVADQYLNVIASNYNADFNEGITNFDFPIADSYDPTELYADAYGITAWGSWTETGYIQGFGGGYPYPTCHLYMDFDPEFQTVRVTVESNTDASGSVSIADEEMNIIVTEDATQFNEGSNEYDFEIASSYNPATLFAYAEGTTTCGVFDETEYVQGFFGTPPNCDLALNFTIDVAVLVYSNIEIDNATIQLWDDGSLFGIESEDLIKGWTKVYFDEISLFSFDVTTCYAEVTAVGASGEIITITTTNDFILNPETGYYENSDIEFCFENKHLHSDWNWESLPELVVNSTTNNGDTDMPTLLTANITPIGYTWLDVLGEDENNLEYENNAWDPLFYAIRSSDGFKIKIQEPEKVYTASGTRVLESTQIDLPAGQWNWIGYWLPHSEMSDIAFGDDWSKVSHMKSEDWTYFNNSMIRGSLPGVNDPVSLGPKPLHYGEGYLVYLSEPIYDFSWQTSSEKSENFIKPESEYFTYDKKADYEVIDVVNIDQSISEIGVFADGVCLGAVVVQDSSEQILVYSESANRDPVPFDFEIITGRGSSIPIKNYEVFNQYTGEFENGIVISGSQEYSLILLGEEGEQKEDLPTTTKLHSNYPNPFNPSTTIEFSVTQNSDFVNLEVYNIKGQKVKTLYSGRAEEGRHTVTWNGDDENDAAVSSGIYFYKLKTGDQELTHKMLLLK